MKCCDLNTDSRSGDIECNFQDHPVWYRQALLNCVAVFKTSHLLTLTRQKAHRELHASSGTNKSLHTKPFSGFPRASVHRPFSPHKSLSADLPPEHQTIWPGQRYQITRPLLIHSLYDSFARLRFLISSHCYNRLNFPSLGLSSANSTLCQPAGPLLLIRTLGSHSELSTFQRLSAQPPGAALPCPCLEISTKQSNVPWKSQQSGHRKRTYVISDAITYVFVSSLRSSCPQQLMHRLHSWFDHQGERNRYQSTAVIHKPSVFSAKVNGDSIRPYLLSKLC